MSAAARLAVAALVVAGSLVARGASSGALRRARSLSSAPRRRRLARVGPRCGARDHHRTDRERLPPRRRLRQRGLRAHARRMRATRARRGWRSRRSDASRISRARRRSVVRAALREEPRGRAPRHRDGACARALGHARAASLGGVGRVARQDRPADRRRLGDVDAQLRRVRQGWAEVAEAAHVELFSAGVELRSWVTTPHAPSFAALLRELRAIYKGPITYSANWDDVEHIGDPR